MAVKVVSLPTLGGYTFERGWEDIEREAHHCSNCGASVRVESPHDLSVTFGRFIRASCPNCNRPESVVILPRLGARQIMTSVQERQFVTDLKEHGAVDKQEEFNKIFAIIVICSVVAVILAGVVSTIL